MDSDCEIDIDEIIKLENDETEQLSSKSSENEQETDSENKPTVCLVNCRFKVIRNIVKEFGFKIVPFNEKWDFYWTDYFINTKRYQNINRFQRINKFPGILQICNKDLLGLNLNKMLEYFPNEYDIFPKTWILPKDIEAVLEYSKNRHDETYILKPHVGSEGRGICVSKSLEHLRRNKRGVCQLYIKPFLLDGYKFDLRIYVVITSCVPLRIYVYNEGLVRLATSKYEEPNQQNLSKVYMHLTNYALNRHNIKFNKNEEGSKRKLSWLKNHLHQIGHNTRYLWSNIDDIVIKTIISAYSTLKHQYLTLFPTHNIIPACCELLGFDIIIDENLYPYILEVNHSPSFCLDTTVDKEVKVPLLTDMFSLININYAHEQRLLRESELYSKNKLEKTKKGYEDYFDQEKFSCGGFRLVYPNYKTKHSYNKYFTKQDEIFASKSIKKARDNICDDKANNEKIDPVEKLSGEQKKINTIRPQNILKNEESNRLESLAKRNCLVKRLEMQKHLYFALKEMGHLTPRAKKKFASFENNLQER